MRRGIPGMTMGPDLTARRLSKVSRRIATACAVPHHGIGQKVRRDNAELIEQLLQRRKAVHIPLAVAWQCGTIPH
jgi:hypothetical protein